ncbi:ABC transporter substrate-binding protein [Paenibacillus sp. S150]|uniref:ABC transporter substrate-binding protein n=1 Tax=Paenibacillus sp. S150 TaxID=2749826 RepID=UPI00281691F9|nr:ABC transporter substrate-binding protein [Paenibacillus sp. S150]
MKNKKLGLLSACLMFGVLAGCGGGNSEANTAGSVPEAAEEPVTLTIYQSKVEIVDALEKLKGEFEAENPSIKLDIQSTIGSDYSVALKAKFAASEAPDIFNNTGESEMISWIDYLEDLSDQPWVEHVQEFAKAPITKDGKLYGMPVNLEAQGFIYNKDLFAKAGITVLPKTLTGFKVMIDQLNAAGIVPFVNNYSTTYTLGRFVFNNPMAKQEDPNAFIQALNDGTASIEGNQVFEDWLDLFDLNLANGNDNPLATDYNTQLNMLATAKGAMTTLGNWGQPALDSLDPNLNFGILPMPINDDAELNDRLFVGVPNYWVINSKSEVKEQAKIFLNWLVSSETGQRYITQEFKFIPAMDNIEASAEDIGSISADALEFIKQDKVLGWYWPKYVEGTTNELGTIMQKYAAGEVAREEVLGLLQAAYKKMN